MFLPIAGIPVLVALTKVDKYDPALAGERTHRVFHSKRIQRLVEVCKLLPLLDSGPGMDSPGIVPYIPVNDDSKLK